MSCSFVKYNVDMQQRRKTLGPAVKGNPKDMCKEASKVLAKAPLGSDVIAEAKAGAKPVTTLATLRRSILQPVHPSCGTTTTAKLSDTSRRPGSHYTGASTKSAAGT